MPQTPVFKPNELRRMAVCAALGMGLPVCVAGQSAQKSPMVHANINDITAGPTRPSSSAGRTGMTVAPEGFEKLKLAPGYLLQMDIYDTPEMSKELRIDEQGNTSIALLGSVHLAGETLPQAEATIAKRFVEQEILVAPQVSLNVVEFSGKNISVLGEVQSPGRIQLLDAKPLGDVLALSGGETEAAGNDIEIQHPGAVGAVQTQHVHYVQGKDAAALQNVVIEPGDTVIVHKAGVIYVLGAVNRPGGYLMVNGGSLNVAQAVSLAGGTTLQAGTRWATVVRPQGDGFTQFRVPLAKMEIGSIPPEPLQLNDVLVVATSTWKTVISDGSSIISAATSASIYRAQ